MSAMIFREKLDKLIDRRGTSQAALSRETGIAQSAISEMTKGKRRPYADQALLLARALGVTLDFLVDDALDEPPASSSGLTSEDESVLSHYRVQKRKEALIRGRKPFTPDELAWRIAEPRYVGMIPVEGSWDPDHPDNQP